jgi:tripartite-type tricarboxylate transporter receptor subunit TctC
MAFALFTLLGASAHAQGDGFPQRPIRIVVPFPAGGYADQLSRLMVLDMAKTFGQPALVDNRPGAGGNIGADLVAKSAPHGYTVVTGTIGTHAINAALYRKMPFDALKDFVPVAFIADAETVPVVSPGVGVHSVGELIALAKAKPGRLSFASGGSGTTGHLAGELFKTATGIDMVHVPYKGNAPAMTDLVSGQIDVSFATLQTALPFIKSGQLIALATLGAVRSPTLPDLPTLQESGIPGFEVRNWTGLFAPAGTPPAIVRKLSDEVDRVLGSPEVQQRMRGEGLRYIRMGPPEFAGFVDTESRKWAKVVKASGAQID